ncbi:MAG TPA: GNAT family N-acetyltransferase [Gaiellaceae bacterium]|jgi:GNAT superfamily N-acetyltransferase
MQPKTTVADCECAQTSWFMTCARVLGGDSWSEGGLTWARSGDHADLLFPAEIDAAALEAGLSRAGRSVTVGAWLSLEVDPSPLAAAGFERGWSPWWMTASMDDVGSASDPRVVLREESSDYVGEHAGYADMLALTRVRPRHTWYAAAYAPPEARFAGQAWSHLASDGIAGIFDMAVWEPFRRRGLGTALLQAVCAAAGAAGATRAVLNATPEGKKLYETCGFRQIGEGITWWLRPETRVGVRRS